MWEAWMQWNYKSRPTKHNWKLQFSYVYKGLDPVVSSILLKFQDLNEIFKLSFFKYFASILWRDEDCNLKFHKESLGNGACNVYSYFLGNSYYWTKLQNSQTFSF